jgi:hypothetical protein
MFAISLGGQGCNSTFQMIEFCVWIRITIKRFNDRVAASLELHVTCSKIIHY